MQHLRVCLFLAVVPLLGGCPTFVFEEPFGEAVALEPANWNGIWLDSSGKWSRFDVVDAGKGAMTIREGCDPESSKRAEVRRARSWSLLQTLPERKKADDPQTYEMQSLFIREGNSLIYYSFNLKRAQELVRSGALPGRTDGDNRVIFGSLKREHYEILLPYAPSVLPIEKGMPAIVGPVVTLTRLPNNFDPCAKAKPSTN